MPSKTSKSRRPPRQSPWKHAPNCSEPELREIARTLAAVIGPRDRVLLEGPMGAGKSTFARALLEAMGVIRPPEGSPTFPIAHEYESRTGTDVVHIDCYRLKSEEELESAGISDYFWTREVRVLCEWLSMFPQFEASVLDPEATPPGVTNWCVRLDFVAENAENTRSVIIVRH